MCGKRAKSIFDKCWNLVTKLCNYFSFLATSATRIRWKLHEVLHYLYCMMQLTLWQETSTELTTMWYSFTAFFHPPPSGQILCFLNYQKRSGHPIACLLWTCLVLERVQNLPIASTHMQITSTCFEGTELDLETSPCSHLLLYPSSSIYQHAARRLPLFIQFTTEQVRSNIDPSPMKKDIHVGVDRIVGVPPPVVVIDLWLSGTG